MWNKIMGKQWLMQMQNYLLSGYALFIIFYKWNDLDYWSKCKFSLLPVSIYLLSYSNPGLICFSENLSLVKVCHIVQN